MAWENPPRTWVAGTIVTADIMNTSIRDTLKYLHGDSGTITLIDGLNLGANELTVNSLEVVGVDGIVNKAVVEDHTHVVAAGNCGQIDHGTACVAASLLDDDHTIYQKESLLTTAGDIPYATGASTWARFGIGTAGQYLKTNASATAPEWGAAVTPTFYELAGTASTTNSTNLTWVDWDVSATCPAGTKYILVLTTLVSGGTVGVRNNGSALNRALGSLGSWITLISEVDTNRICETYGKTGGVNYYLFGYWA